MVHDSDIEKAAGCAADCFGDQFHCAEAVVLQSLDALGKTSGDAVAHATAFGGGYGRTFTETCGVISGMMIVIGHLYGRRQPGESWDIPAALGAEMRSRFVKRHGTANCQVLRKRFGDEKQMAECRELVRTGVKDLLTFLTSAEIEEIIDEITVAQKRKNENQISE